MGTTNEELIFWSLVSNVPEDFYREARFHVFRVCIFHSLHRMNISCSDFHDFHDLHDFHAFPREKISKTKMLMSWPKGVGVGFYSHPWWECTFGILNSILLVWVNSFLWFWRVGDWERTGFVPPWNWVWHGIDRIHWRVVSWSSGTHCLLAWLFPRYQTNFVFSNSSFSWIYMLEGKKRNDFPKK